MPPIKKREKLASGRETEVKRWLPLVRSMNKNKKVKSHLAMTGEITLPELAS